MKVPSDILAIGAIKAVTEIIEGKNPKLLDFNFKSEEIDGKLKVIYYFTFEGVQ